MTRNTTVALLHSEEYTNVLYKVMEYVHKDRDLLLASLLHYCGFIRQTPRVFTVVKPKKASRQQLECFHHAHYLQVLNPQRQSGQSHFPLELLDTFGLTEDCALPESHSARALLWEYCRSVAGASLHAAQLLTTDQANVAINWGGGRHHAHPACAGGFCYVNDVVLAIELLKKTFGKVLYVDIDIHHADGVQRAFYDTDKVLTVSFHRHAPGFFPSDSGSSGEKGKHDTRGVGHNLNLPLPKATSDAVFCKMFCYVFTRLLVAYDPDAVVLCVGADGLNGDPLVGDADGWNLTPEGLAECVRFTSEQCGARKVRNQTDENVDTENESDSQTTTEIKQRKLLLLGGGGYNPVQTARTFLLCTAAACEGARPGMLWKELPSDIPKHDHFHRYGPDFVLKRHNSREELTAALKEWEESIVQNCKAEINVTALYLESQRRKQAIRPDFSFSNDPGFPIISKKKVKRPFKKKPKPTESTMEKKHTIADKNLEMNDACEE